MPNTRYNASSLLNPYQGLLTSPANGIVDIDHMTNVGLTGDPSLAAKYVGRQNFTSGTATFVRTAATAAGRYGTNVITPDGTGNGRIQQETASVYLSTSSPWIVEASVNFVTAGVYFVGFAELIASATVVITTGGAFAAAVQGCGICIQTDDKLDIISMGTDDSANTAVTDLVTLTAGTWYRLGVKAWQGKVEAYVDGRKVGQQTMTHTITTAMTPCVAQATVTSGKNLTVDWIGVAY